MITDLNIELNAFQDQIEEIVRRSHIQKEEGEQEMLNLLNGSQPTNTTPITEEKISKISHFWLYLIIGRK
ncbi:hypothetical protein FPS14_contig00029-00011 [Flavobacterium psychrophilum]|nr:hypothetical protein FPS14_contig00029-00011 [Flavobacterium psychrophilum]